MCVAGGREEERGEGRGGRVLHANFPSVFCSWTLHYSFIHYPSRVLLETWYIPVSIIV